MRKKLTITLDADIYEGLHRVVGARRISRFIEERVRPHLIDKDELEADYAALAAAEAADPNYGDWEEEPLGDEADESR
ncbi:hypothetical protein [Longimicrobium sp.]|uniref:hypothetical protein n=1 Tax=Longimicrobium sp. TaxID=2029185 RepID=UPI002F95C0A0